MEPIRPIVLSIAGFDPSGGAGLLADIKTFEQHNVYGLGISTAQTVQTESDFFGIRWEADKDILDAIEKMLSQYEVKVIKIGIVSTIGSLKKIISFIHQKDSNIRIVLDPIIKSSTGFDFWNEKMNQGELFETLSKIYLVTPNYNEVLQLIPSESAKSSAQQLTLYCNVLLKGGHNEKEIGVDYLFTKGNIEKIEAETLQSFAKHGSGCVLSSAIVANLARGFELDEACRKAKKYTEQFLGSTTTLLGYHHV